jgi:hypothetical protein
MTKYSVNPSPFTKTSANGLQGTRPLPGLLRAEPLTEIVKSRALDRGVGQSPTGVQGQSPCKKGKK